MHLGLQPCSLLWVCPDCAAKITERRREELREMVSRQWARGGKLLMLTLTLPHHANQSVAELRSKLIDRRRGAWYKLINNRAWRDWWKPLKGLDGGMVRAVEITFGLNGPHPHMHVLLFYDGQAALDIDRSRELLQDAWRAAVRKAGIVITAENEAAFHEHGVRLDWGNARIADYIDKWGVQSELTKGHIKKGRNDGLTPFDLLREIDRLKRSGLSFTRLKYENWFREFADAFHGTKQLCFSKGLRASLGMDPEKTDAELAEDHVDEGWKPIYMFGNEDQELVSHYSAWSVVLNAAEQCGVAGIERLLRGLRYMARRGRHPPPLKNFARQPGYEKLELRELTDAERSPVDERTMDFITRWHLANTRRREAHPFYRLSPAKEFWKRVTAVDLVRKLRLSGGAEIGRIKLFLENINQ